MLAKNWKWSKITKLLGTLGAILLGSLLTADDTIGAGEGVIGEGERTIRVAQSF